MLLWSFSTWANLSPLKGSDVRPSLLPSETYRIRCPLPPPFLHPKKPVLIFRRREALAGGINIFFRRWGVMGDGWRRRVVGGFAWWMAWPTFPLFQPPSRPFPCTYSSYGFQGTVMGNRRRGGKECAMLDIRTHERDGISMNNVQFWGYVLIVWGMVFFPKMLFCRRNF